MSVKKVETDNFIEQNENSDPSCLPQTGIKRKWSESGLDNDSTNSASCNGLIESNKDDFSEKIMSTISNVVKKAKRNENQKSIEISFTDAVTPSIPFTFKLDEPHLITVGNNTSSQINMSKNSPSSCNSDCVLASRINDILNRFSDTSNEVGNILELHKELPDRLELILNKLSQNKNSVNHLIKNNKESDLDINHPSSSISTEPQDTDFSYKIINSACCQEISQDKSSKCGVNENNMTEEYVYNCSEETISESICQKAISVAVNEDDIFEQGERGTEKKDTSLSESDLKTSVNDSSVKNGIPTALCPFSYSGNKKYILQTTNSDKEVEVITILDDDSGNECTPNEVKGRICNLIDAPINFFSNKISSRNNNSYSSLNPSEDIDFTKDINIEGSEASWDSNDGKNVQIKFEKSENSVTMIPIELPSLEKTDVSSVALNKMPPIRVKSGKEDLKERSESAAEQSCEDVNFLVNPTKASTGGLNDNKGSYALATEIDLQSLNAFDPVHRELIKDKEFDNITDRNIEKEGKKDILQGDDKDKVIVKIENEDSAEPSGTMADGKAIEIKKYLQVKEGSKNKSSTCKKSQGGTSANSKDLVSKVIVKTEKEDSAEPSGTMANGKAIEINKYLPVKEESKNESSTCKKSQGGTAANSKDFVSNDPAENDDNFNPKWKVLSEVKTEAARYKEIRKRWQNLSIPDPHRNLTFRHNRKHPQASTSSGKKGSTAQRVTRYSYQSIVEDLKREACDRFNHTISQQTINHQQDIADLFSNYPPGPSQDYGLNRLVAEHYRTMTRMRSEYDFNIASYENYQSEARIFFKFYQGLDSNEDKSLLTQEQVDLYDETERMYGAFQHFYA